MKCRNFAAETCCPCRFERHLMLMLRRSWRQFRTEGILTCRLFFKHVLHIESISIISCNYKYMYDCISMILSSFCLTVRETPNLGDNRQRHKHHSFLIRFERHELQAFYQLLWTRSFMVCLITWTIQRLYAMTRRTECWKCLENFPTAVAPFAPFCFV